MAKAFRRKGERFVARLDESEREVLLGLFEQTRGFVAPQVRESTGDPFEDLVATLGLPRLDADRLDAGQLDAAQLDAGQPDGDRLEDELRGAREPRDPAEARLFPDAHREDDAVAAEFRRLTEQGLRERKTANLTTAIEALKAVAGDRVELDGGQAEAMVVALTDVRLLLGERLGLRTDEDADELLARVDESGEDDPLAFLAACYDFLTWLQESLTQALLTP